MRYMLLIYANEQGISPEAREHCYVESAGLTRQLAAEGKYLAAAPLQSVTTATSVRMREGKRLIVDGPFAETREQLGGYYLVDAKDLDDAIEIAGRIPGARWGTVEIRPVVTVAGLPEKAEARMEAQAV